MNFFIEHKWTHRHKRQINVCQRGNGREEFGIINNIYTLLEIKYITNNNLLGTLLNSCNNL